MLLLFVVIKEAVLNSALERFEVIIAVIVHIYKELKYNNGMIIWYDDNTKIVNDKKEIQRELEFLVQSLKN
jgi:ribosomal protein L14